MKKEKEVQTRHNELKFRTADKAKMLNRYLAENVIAEYPEKMADDNGDVVEIKRTQKLFDLGIERQKDQPTQ